MQQLTLQFDGLAQEQQRVDVVAPARKTVRVMNQAAARVKSVASELSVRAQRTVSPWLADWQSWALKRNDTFTKLCGSEGETFRNIEVVRAHLYCLFVLFISALIGG